MQKSHEDSPYFQKNYYNYQYAQSSKPLRDLIEQVEDQYEQAQAQLDIYQNSSQVYWQALAYTDDGQIEQARYGNEVISNWNYDNRGRVNLIKAEKQNNALQHMSFQYDSLGNLAERNDFVSDLRETFQYDHLNRLILTNMSGQGADIYDFADQTSQSFEYDVMGNITYKSDVGYYTYAENGAGVHALTSTAGLINENFTYDENGNQISGNSRSIDYAAYNKPVRIQSSGGVNEFRYGPERQLIYQDESIGASNRVTRYVGGIFEETINPSGDKEAVHHLTMAGHTIGVLKTQPDLNDPTSQPVVNSLHFLHQDHLESVVMITDENGNVVEKNHYDAFGKKRLAVVDINNAQWYAARFLPITDRSFTGHRYLPEPELVHMKGRVYDPVFARFLSADPHIQAPLMSQSYNRYSYVLNNPLSLTDPSGYFFSWFKKLFKKIVKIVKKIIKVVVNHIKKVVKAIENLVGSIMAALPAPIRIGVIVLVAFYAPQVVGKFWAFAKTAIGAGFVGGFAAGFLSTGSLKGALIGGLTGAALGYVGAKFGNIGQTATIVGKEGVNIGNVISSGVFKGLTHLQAFAQSVAHGVINGISSVLSGGKFGKAFITGFVNKIASPFVQNGKLGFDLGNLARQTVFGGVVSKLVGGDFYEGAKFAFLATLFNQFGEDTAMNGKESVWSRVKNLFNGTTESRVREIHGRWLNNVSGHNNPGDAARHAGATNEIAREVGVAEAYVATYYYEFYYRPNADFRETRMDIRNNLTL